MAQEQKAKEPSISFRWACPRRPRWMDVEVAEGDLKPRIRQLVAVRACRKPHTRFEAPLKVTARAKYTTTSSSPA